MENITLEKLPRDPLLLIAMQMDLPTLDTFCKAGKRIYNKIYNNEIFWKNKLTQDFPGFIKHSVRLNELTNLQLSNREQYYFLTRILTKKRFEKIIDKPNIASEILGVTQDVALDLYDLLYDRDADHGWGVITISSLENGPMMQEYYALGYLLNETFDTYREGDMGRIRSFLTELSHGKFHEEIESSWGSLIEDFDIPYSTSVEYISSLLTFEKRFQSYIIENTPEDVREEIKRYQCDIGDNLESALYNGKDIAFLQILHDGIRSKKLNLFDPIDYDFLMFKLRQK
jgi:hypothetical protein